MMNNVKAWTALKQSGVLGWGGGGGGGQGENNMIYITMLPCYGKHGWPLAKPGVGGGAAPPPNPPLANPKDEDGNR